jgi:hypothetical protein
MLHLFHVYFIFVLVLFSIAKSGLSVMREGGKALSIAVPVKIRFALISGSFCLVFMTVTSLLSADFLNFGFQRNFLQRPCISVEFAPRFHFHLEKSVPLQGHC